MGDERRWAARYQFLDELWRGRDRIVCDRELEAVLHAGVEGPLAGLLSGLIPGETRGGRGDRGGDASGERVWVALHNDRRAASFARERSGTVFLAVEEAAEIASDEAWQVALVNLGEVSAQVNSRADLLGSGSGMEAFLEVLGERVEDDAERSVVLSLACGADEDRTYELLGELVEELFGDGRIYGLTRPGMVGFYDFGPVIEAPSESESGADIEIDNSLGSENPRFEAFIAVVGARVPGEGVTLIELPAPAAESEGGAALAGDEDLAALRVQLAEAQRRGDLQAIERQALLEQLEQAEDRIASLQDQLGDQLESNDQVDAGQAETGSAEPTSASGPRVDELLAREQSLRWEIERLRGELERLEARPVEALEAEVARLQAQLAGVREQLEATETQLDELEAELSDQVEADSDQASASAETLADHGIMLDDGEEPTAAQIREWRRGRSKLEHLLRKLERGGRLSALELHRELAQLRRLL